MKSIQITDGAHKALVTLKELLWEQTNESYGQIVNRIVQAELDHVHKCIAGEKGEPIIDKDGNKRWYNSEGKLHRNDAPAVENVDGRKEYFINGMMVKFEIDKRLLDGIYGKKEK